MNNLNEVQGEPVPVLEEEVKTKPAPSVSITSIAAQIAQEQAEGIVRSQEKDLDAPPPSESQM